MVSPAVTIAGAGSAAAAAFTAAAASGRAADAEPVLTPAHLAVLTWPVLT